MSASGDENQAFRVFLRRVWREDVAPKLRDHRAAQRRTSARTVGKLAASTGLLFDSLLGLRGKPFARLMTVVGSSLGAMLPDVWDWEWLRANRDAREQEFVRQRFAAQAARLPEAEALALFDLPPTATRDELKSAWRALSQKWHPDKAQDEAQRAEHHVRFVAYSAAYETLCTAFDEGRLPTTG